MGSRLKLRGRHKMTTGRLLMYSPVYLKVPRDFKILFCQQQSVSSQSLKSWEIYPLLASEVWIQVFHSLWPYRYVSIPYFLLFWYYSDISALYISQSQYQYHIGAVRLTMLTWLTLLCGTLEKLHQVIYLKNKVQNGLIFVRVFIILETLDEVRYYLISFLIGYWTNILWQYKTRTAIFPCATFQNWEVKHSVSLDIQLKSYLASADREQSKERIQGNCIWKSSALEWKTIIKMWI